MPDKPLQIPIDKIKADFQTFLAPDHNRRIIFSGPFGIGKTYFLNEFFEEKDEYLPVFLRPINYSILSNEDVFKFIKYDILIQLINQKIIKIGRDLSVSRISNAKSFVKSNKLLILKNLLKVIPSLGGVANGIDSFQELYQKYQQGLNKAEDLNDASVNSFMVDLENNFLLEYDNVSKFIQEKLTKIEKKKVLIIDDLDRLDPEHIFRLFNVFSAHFDLVDDNSNKFGFDKIIFVCDIENIRKIFAHKYGGEVDFSGYIDKFYSTEVYQFLHELDFRDDIYPFFQAFYSSRFNDNYSSNFFNTNKLIFQLLFDNNEISIRDMERIQKLKQKAFKIDYVKVPFTACYAQMDSHINIYGILISLRLFRIIYGNEEVLFNKLNRALDKNLLNKDGGYFQYEIGTIISQLLLFSEIETHKFSSGSEKFKYNLRTGQTVEYSLVSEAPSSQFIASGPYHYYVNLDVEEGKLTGEFQHLLRSSIQNISKYGLLP